MLERYLPDGLPDWGWWALILGALVVACFKAYHKVRIQRDSALTKVQNFYDECAFCLAISSVDVTENQATQQKQIILNLANTSNHPMKYEIRKFVIDGNVVQNTLNSGGLIVGAGSTKFRSTWTMLPPSVGGNYVSLFDVEIEYGHPSKLTRLREIGIRVDYNFKSSELGFVYTKENEKGLE
jgi:hypothetical protein